MAKFNFNSSPVCSFICALFFFGSSAWACDPCALYSASRLMGYQSNAYTLAVSEQHTSFDKAQALAGNSPRDVELVRGFSTTQLSLAHDLSDAFALQLTLPIIYRNYDSITSYRSKTETDTGLGDASVVGRFSLFDFSEGDWILSGSVLGGVKFPTGDAGTLERVAGGEEAEDPSEQMLLRHHPISSASGGQALALGSGSFDYIFGTSLVSRNNRTFFMANSQYTLRTEGDFEYEFADDFLWSVGPGYFIVLDHAFSLALRCSLSGEQKSSDKLDNELVVGSQISNLYLGPEIIFTFDEKLSAEVGIDFRVTDEDINATVVPEYRLKASLAYRFS